MACFVHDARVAAGAAKVALLDDAQAIAEVLLHRRESRLVGGVLIALVRHDQCLDHRVHFRVAGQRLECSDRIRRAVEGGDAHGDLWCSGGQHVTGGVGLGCSCFDVNNGRLGLQYLAFGLLGGVPTSGVDDGFRLTGDVEPDPTAVLELVQGDDEGGLATSGLVSFHDSAGHGDAGTIDLGAVQVNTGIAREIYSQFHLGQLRPAAPVAGGESIEVRLEGDLDASRDDCLGAGQCGDSAGYGLVFHDVKRTHVIRFATLRQDDAAQAGGIDRSGCFVCSSQGGIRHVRSADLCE